MRCNSRFTFRLTSSSTNRCLSLLLVPIFIVVCSSFELFNYAQLQILSANQNGYMTLGIDTDSATVTTHFKHLDTPTWGNCIDLLVFKEWITITKSSG